MLACDNTFDAIGSVGRSFDVAVPGKTGETSGRDPVKQPFVGEARIHLGNASVDGLKPALIKFFLRSDGGRNNNWKTKSRIKREFAWLGPKNICRAQGMREAAEIFLSRIVGVNVRVGAEHFL